MCEVEWGVNSKRLTASNMNYLMQQKECRVCSS